MNLYDFDRAFYEYCATWLKEHPGVTEEQLDDEYNALMAKWLDAPVSALGGATPKAYFAAYNEPEELLDMLEACDAQGMTAPELLYARVVELGESARDALERRITDAEKSDAVRCACFTLLRDIDAKRACACARALVLAKGQPGELTELAAGTLSGADADTLAALMDAYEGADDDTARIILDICSNGFDPRVTEACERRMLTHPEDRVFCASLLGRMGDESALPALEEMLRRPELGYVEYREIANAVEMLGGDPSEERDFSGDADLEALKAADVDWGLE